MSKAIRNQLLLTTALALMAAISCTCAWQMAFGETQEAPAITIRYTGSDNSQISGTDLFDSSEALVPGDHRKADLTVENDSSDGCSVWLRADVKNIAEQSQGALGKAVRLTVSNAKGGTVYEGDLSGEDLAQGQSLGSVEAGNAYALTFDLEVPAELGNDYALSQANCDWVVTVVQEEAQSPTSSAAQTAAPRTGDSATMVAVCIVSVALSSLAIIISRNRSKRKEK